MRCNICGIEKSNINCTKSRVRKNCTHNKRKPFFVKNNEEKRLTHTLQAMLQRCYNTNAQDYKFYGGKGIEVCRDWAEDTGSFINWAINNGYGNTLTIDRIDSSKDYCPENCRWITSSDNARYKSTTKVMVVDGISLTGRQWASRLNIGTNMVNNLIRKYGEEATKEFIKWALYNQEKLKSKKHNKASYYSIFQESNK